MEGEEEHAGVKARHVFGSDRRRRRRVMKLKSEADAGGMER